MTDKTWKQFERRIAKRVGGRRLGPTGTDTADVVSPWLVVECKHRSTLPAWVQKALDKARRNAEPDQLGLAVLHEKGTRDVDSLVVLSLGDFLAWFDPVPRGPDGGPTA